MGWFVSNGNNFENIQDMVDLLFADGGGIVWSYDDNANTMTPTHQNITWAADATYDIGSADAGTTLLRPRDYYGSRNLLIGKSISFSTTTNPWQFRPEGTVSGNKSMFVMAAGGVPSLTFGRTNGTIDSPSQVLSGDTLFAITAVGRGASAYRTLSGEPIALLAAENWTNSAAGASLRFRTVKIGGSTARTIVEYNSEGNILINPTSQSAANIPGNILWTVDGQGSIGAASGATRPENGYFKTLLEAPTLQGGFAASGNLSLSSTSHATKGQVQISEGSNFVVDGETNIPAASRSTMASFSGGTIEANEYVVARVGASPGTYFLPFSARGSFATPDYLDAGDVIFSIYAQGYNGTDINDHKMATIEMVAAENHANNALGTKITFNITPVGTSSDFQSLVLDENGDAIFGGALSTPEYLSISQDGDPGAQTNAVALGAKDTEDSARTIHLRTEQAVAADVALASTHSLKVWINGVAYKLALTTI